MQALCVAQQEHVCDLQQTVFFQADSAICNWNTHELPNQCCSLTFYVSYLPCRSHAEDDGIALRTMDIFAGCGGLSEGFQQAGAAICKWAIEYEHPAAQAFKLNHPEAHVMCNNCNVILTAAMHKAGLQNICKASPEVVAGVCHGHHSMDAPVLASCKSLVCHAQAHAMMLLLTQHHCICCIVQKLV